MTENEKVIFTALVAVNIAKYGLHSALQMADHHLSLLSTSVMAYEAKGHSYYDNVGFDILKEVLFEKNE